MITTKTVFILGAGASASYGFPFGKELIEKTGGLGSSITDTLSSLGFSGQDIGVFNRTLIKAQTPSINEFLEHNHKFADIGKALISTILIRCENEGNLHSSNDHWYEYLVNKMITSFEDIDKNNISIITFNYDRSFEHYLFSVIKNRFDKSSEEVASKIQKIPIIHVYGRLGFLEWQKNEDNLPIRQYNTLISPEEISKAVECIKIIPENTDDTEEFLIARKLLQESAHIYFLGFGYHPTNMKRLKFPLIGKDKFRIIVAGTSFDFTEEEKDVLAKQYEGIILGPTNYKILEYLRNDPLFHHEEKGKFRGRT